MKSDLRTLQRFMLGALTQPLTTDDDLALRTRNGSDLTQLAAAFIKPNDRLNSFERLQIYARSYWYRLIDCLDDDCPALRALLGDEKFSRLARAYLAACPSRSFTLRDLGSRLPQFILERTEFTAPDTELAHAIARFEWAQTVAFDGGARPPLNHDDIADVAPAQLRLALQPYITLFSADWAIDEFVLAAKRRGERRAIASNAAGAVRRRTPARWSVRPRRERVFIVVHRCDHTVFYKRVDAAAFAILDALVAGQPFARALLRAPRATAAQVGAWFTTWTQLGWFCRRAATPSVRPRLASTR